MQSIRKIYQFTLKPIINSPLHRICFFKNSDKNESHSGSPGIKCLDIDSNYFTSMIFLAIHQKDEMYRMMT
jgi:hypothetical protein